MPVTCCMLHLLGSGFGQNGSTLNIGAPFPSTLGARGCCAPPEVAAHVNTPAQTRMNDDCLVMPFLPYLLRLSAIRIGIPGRIPGAAYYGVACVRPAECRVARFTLDGYAGVWCP